METNDIERLAARLRSFAAERDWDQFHSPKNLAGALAVEAGEVLECFQWLSEKDSMRLDAERREGVALELADVLLYLIRLADKLGVDLIQAADRKMAINARKYPPDRFRGSSRKYTEG
jgi:NTP pyrophosphatase (non-canonical NTP hydrolase)